jgi:selenophosphate synthetase-related protein
LNPPVVSSAADPADLPVLAALVRVSPGLRAKHDLDLLDRLPGGRAAFDGDDAAAIPQGDGFLLVCAEAISPALLEGDPFAAGAAAVATNVADIRAMGGRPLALVDTLVSPDRAHAERVLDGLAWAAGLLGVPVVGGHLTIADGAAALSAACTGTARALLRAADARPGDALLAAFCLDGRWRNAPGIPIFTSLRDRPPERLRDDGEALVEVAEAGLCRAARDVSMPGVAGSLLQMLELTAGCGATLDLDRLPRPAGVALADWLVTFPSFGFLLAAPPERVEAATAAFTRRGLACAPCGAFDDSGVLRLAAGGATAEVWDLAAEPVTRPGPR